jgi:murein L,D-transpeptidase YcbB/YkuD
MFRQVLTFLALLMQAATADAQPPAPSAVWQAQDMDALQSVVEAVSAEGLDPTRYSLRSMATARAARDDIAAHLAASALFTEIANDFVDGAALPADRVRWRISKPAVDAIDSPAFMAQALEDHQVFETLTSLLPRSPQYLALKSALANAPPDSSARRLLEANMERWRWAPRDFGESYVLVNVPSQDLVVVRNGAEVLRKRVIVGARSTPTWQFSAEITGVAFNPIWFIPKSIAEGEGISALLRDKPSTARRRGYYVGDDGGVRQKPGPLNPLGRIKFVMPNRFDAYVHDTPFQNHFAREVRALSHGCMRVEGAADLARELLGSSWTDETIAALIATGSTALVDLAKPIPIYVVYFTAVADGEGRVLAYPDVYGLDDRLIRGLKKGGETAADLQLPAKALAGDCAAAS